MGTAALTSTTLALPSGSTISLLYHLPSVPSSTSPTLLFLPFWGGSVHTFTSILKSLATTSPSTTTIAISYPGTGTSLSDQSDSDPSHHDIPSLSRTLFTALSTPLFQSLTPSHTFTIIAHSMSAKVTYSLLSALLTSSPSPSNIKISSLVLLAPAPPTPLILPAAIRNQQLTAYSTLDSARWTMRNVLSSKPLSDEVVDSLASDATHMSEGAKKGWIELGMGCDCSDELQEISQVGPRIPVRVLVGSEDKIETVEKVQRDSVQVLKRAGWDVSMRIIEGVGHLLPVEAVDEVVEETCAIMEGKVW